MTMTVTDPISTHPTLDQVWGWLGEVPDPEIPAVSIVDLGMIRGVRWRGAEGEELVVSVTPTYSGCPATSAINLAIDRALRAHGIKNPRLERQLSPPWTTDWITEEGRLKLEAYGIAVTAEKAGGFSPLDRLFRKPVMVTCPRCGSTDTAKVSEFGSTPCKAQYQCRACREPFDYFKCV
jgi:ring-1,2-phenylacetyl-CoA epoxidase subunit PaaD